MSEWDPSTRLIKRVIPASVYRPIISRWRRLTRTRLRGDLLDRTEPVSGIWGLDRGTPIDRWYTERFLEAHAQDVKGHTLEMADDRYTRAFGGERVTKSDVLHYVNGNPNPHATLVGDLSTGQNIPRSSFDCMIIVNTFPSIFEIEDALRVCHGALRPGGVLLANFHGLWPAVPEIPDWEGDYWRFTSASVRRLLERVFGNVNISIEPVGNVRSAAGFLYGLSAEEIGKETLLLRDDRYELLVNARAQRI